jgi:hypothetical protein
VYDALAYGRFYRNRPIRWPLVVVVIIAVTLGLSKPAAARSLTANSLEAEAYFLVADEEVSFTVKLTDPAKIRQFRQELAAPTGAGHVRGMVVATSVAYNPDWHFLLEPSSIELFQIQPEVCDASIWAIEDAARAGLERRIQWCPWGSQLKQEVFPIIRY